MSDPRCPECHHPFHDGSICEDEGDWMGAPCFCSRENPQPIEPPARTAAIWIEDQTRGIFPRNIRRIGMIEEALAQAWENGYDQGRRETAEEEEDKEPGAADETGQQPAAVQP